jgi:ribosomal protein L11 methyltransferase
MDYTSLRFDVDAQDADAWSDALLDAGALSVDISDPHAGAPGEVPVFGEPGSASTLWPVSRITALFAADRDVDAALAQARTTLGRACPASERSTVAEQDWVRATQAQFAPIRIDEGLWIVPSWCAPPDASAITLTLDPGLAFGTGSHPTTRLCLQWLRANVSGAASVLDYGCGSGILAIAAAKLGAARVAGTDIDPQALSSSGANARANGVSAWFGAPDALPEATYTIVVANILANPLILLAPALGARTAIGGRIALSGILDAQADEVRAAYAPWFKLAAWRADEDWLLLTGERHTWG